MKTFRQLLEAENVDKLFDKLLKKIHIEYPKIVQKHNKLFKGEKDEEQMQFDRVWKSNHDFIKRKPALYMELLDLLDNNFHISENKWESLLNIAKKNKGNEYEALLKALTTTKGLKKFLG